MLWLPQLLGSRRHSSHRQRGKRSLRFECLEDRNLLALVIDLGVQTLLPNTAHQPVRIMVARTDPAADPLVTGFNLRAQLGDGTGPVQEPVFEAVDFTGGMWAAYPAATTGGPVAGWEQFAQASVVFNRSGDAVPAEGLAVTLVISTAGLTAGSYPLRLAGTEIGADSDFVGLQAAEVTVSIVQGSLTVGAPWQNPRDHFDVNDDTHVTPLDALLVINDLNVNGSRILPRPPVPPNSPPPYPDVNGDGACTPLDVLLVVEFLNEAVAGSTARAVPGMAGSEGESPAARLAADSSATGAADRNAGPVTKLAGPDSATDRALWPSPGWLASRADELDGAHDPTGVLAGYGFPARWRFDRLRLLAEKTSDAWPLSVVDCIPSLESIDGPRAVVTP